MFKSKDKTINTNTSNWQRAPKNIFIGYRI